MTLSRQLGYCLLSNILYETAPNMEIFEMSKKFHIFSEKLPYLNSPKLCR